MLEEGFANLHEDLFRDILAGDEDVVRQVAAARHDTRGIYAFNSGFHNTVASAALRFAIDPKTDLRVALRYNDDAFHYPTSSDGTVADTNARNTQDRTMLSLELTRAFTPMINGQVTLTTEGSAGGTDDKPDSETGSGLQTVDRTRRRTADVRGNFVLSRTTLTAGAQAEQQDQHNEQVSVFGDEQFPSTTRVARRNAALYWQALATLPVPVVLTAGARLDHNERFGDFGTYRVGSTWSPLASTHLRASFGTAFREPTFLENYSTGFVTGNPDLVPERSATWEVGIRQALWNDRVMFGITHFDQRFKKMIDYTGSTTECGFSYCNVAQASAKGREFEARFSPVPRLAFDANLTHVETKVLDPGYDTTSGGLYRANEQLIRRPTTSWNLGASFTDAHGSADVNDANVGPYPALPVVVDAYTRTDVSGVLPLGQFATRLNGAELTLRVENAFDKKYQSVYNFQTPRRMVLAGARATF